VTFGEFPFLMLQIKMTMGGEKAALALLSMFKDMDMDKDG